MCLLKQSGYFVNDQPIPFGFRMESKDFENKIKINEKIISQIILLFSNCVIIYLWLSTLIPKFYKI